MIARSFQSLSTSRFSSHARSLQQPNFRHFLLSGLFWRWRSQPSFQSQWPPWLAHHQNSLHSSICLSSESHWRYWCVHPMRPLHLFKFLATVQHQIPNRIPRIISHEESLEDQYKFLLSYPVELSKKITRALSKWKSIYCSKTRLSPWIISATGNLNFEIADKWVDILLMTSMDHFPTRICRHAFAHYNNFQPCHYSCPIHVLGNFVQGCPREESDLWLNLADGFGFWPFYVLLSQFEFRSSLPRFRYYVEAAYWWSCHLLRCVIRTKDCYIFVVCSTNYWPCDALSPSRVKS